MAFQVARSKDPFQFADDEDDEKFVFGNRGKHNRLYPQDDPRRQPQYEQPRDYQQAMMLKDQLEDSTLESTRNTLKHIYESEQIGSDTAKELVRQGEQLDKTEQTLHNINGTLDTSQKTITRIRSIFGGFKNMFSKSKPGQEPAPPTSTASKLKEDLENDRFSTSAQPVGRSQTFDSGATGSDSGRSLEQKSKQAFTRDDEIDENLDLMCGGVSRLRTLAVGLGSEIDRQNEQIDRISGLTDKTDVRVQDQSKQVRKLL